jgi:hypothetical protein
MMDPCREASLIPRVGLICPPDGLDEESALDFCIKVTFVILQIAAALPQSTMTTA